MGSPEDLQSLTAKEIDERKRWLGLSLQDEALIKEIDGLVASRGNELIDEMYRHFLSSENTASFFPDRSTLERAKKAQLEYFLRLTKGDYNEEYVKDRLRVGSTHYRIDLDPKWYLGAYSHFMEWLSELLVTRLSSPEKLWRTLSACRKLIFFDMGLAIETYIQAKEAAIRAHIDTLKELQTEKKVTKSILENAPVGIISLSDKLVCNECNAKFLEMANVEREQVLGQHLSEFAPGLPTNIFTDVLNSGDSFEQMAEPLNFTKKTVTGQSYYDWAVWPVKNNADQIIGLVTKFSNASDRMLVQQQREDFVATLTHDLKTPILAANRAVQLLMDGDFGMVSEEQRQILQTIQDSNSSLYKLVLTLLDVYRYDSGAKELTIAPVDLVLTINHIAAELRPLAQSQQIELTTVLPENARTVFCDEDEIRRVLQNLLDNAVKFTPAGGSITIFMEQTEKDTRIAVKDTGKGILDEDLPKLFQRFWQSRSGGRYYASTGLGLYLCRKIVERHHGQISCQSKVGVGSTFEFSIDHTLVAGSN